MAELYRPQDNWNEFQWEQEIRRDERRISCYYRELPACLDLPGEEEMIFSSLLSRPDLVPAAKNPDSLRSWHGSPEEDDEEFDDEESARRPGSEVVDQLDHLTAEWNMLAAAQLRADLELPGLGISCAYAKLLARVADFVDTDEQHDRAQKLSLGKRSLADLNDLTGELYRLAGIQRSLKEALLLHVELLGHVREQLIDHLTRLRTQASR